MESIHPLRAYRDKQTPPLTQDALADLLGVNRTTVARWETGARKVDEEYLPRVVERTGIAATELRPDLVALLRRPDEVVAGAAE